MCTGAESDIRYSGGCIDEGGVLEAPSPANGLFVKIGFFLRVKYGSTGHGVELGKMTAEEDNTATRIQPQLFDSQRNGLLR